MCMRDPDGLLVLRVRRFNRSKSNQPLELPPAPSIAGGPAIG